jgi:hypothetical protein
MIGPKYLASSSLLLVCVLVMSLTACHVDVDKNDEAGHKKVDISTPVGGLHVSENVDLRDIGLPIYPGAKPVEKETEGNRKSANVNISTTWFGLKVVAQEFESADPTEKLIDYYTGELKKYGSVLRCQTKWHGGNVNVGVNSKSGKDDKDSHELKCDSQTGDTVELKVGVKEKQHIVAIEPNGKGSKFALVYVQIRDKEDMI